MRHQVDERPVPEPVAEAGLREDVRRVRHRLHPARHDELRVAGADHRVGDLDRADRRRAHLVDRVRRHLDRDPRTDCGLPRGRLPGAALQHLAHDHVVDVAARNAGALEARANRDRAELRRLQVLETAAELPEGRANGGDDDGAAHATSVAAQPQRENETPGSSRRANATSSRTTASMSSSWTISTGVCMLRSGIETTPVAMPIRLR